MKTINFHWIAVIILLLNFSNGFSQNPYDADLVVAQDGSGDFTTVQEAIDAVPSNEVTRTVIYIRRGIYDTQKLIVPADKQNITLIGESREETILSYHLYHCTAGICPPEDAALWSGDNLFSAATLTIMGDGFRAENLTIENSAGPTGQAQAITINGADKVSFVSCNITGYQDTIYLVEAGDRSYFDNCLIIGRTDYIYGASIAFFNECEIRSWGGGWITAPSTPADQDYGYVFYACDITYADESPRAGDDGSTFGLGRPWHEYPKVAWLYCDMTEMVNPLGWPTTWNMPYADTSAGLHLYEYENTGAGADMSGRADWTGLRALTSEEAPDYESAVVLAGSDNWDPASEPAAVSIYNWTGSGANSNWLNQDNWDLGQIPANGESAFAEGATISADGEHFEADLNLISSTLDVTANSEVTFLGVAKTSISSSQDVSLTGKIKIKDSLSFDISGNLDLQAELIGDSKIIKSGNGGLNIAENNSAYTGEWIVEDGNLTLSSQGALGEAGLSLSSTSSLTVNSEDAFYSKAPLKVETGTSLELNADVVISEFYIDGNIQEIGDYSASTNPDIISGTGQVKVGRPEFFTFVGGEDAAWDNPDHFVPALMPEEGEIVYCDKEIETTGTVFKADLYLTAGGNVRQRGDHRATGDIHFAAGTSIRYNTSGSGFSLEAPLFVDGNIDLVMESGNAGGSSMKLEGPITGSDTVFSINNGKGTVNIGIADLSGDNRNFDGVWDATRDSRKYPGADYISAFEASGAYALGNGKVNLGLQNKLILSHPYGAGETLRVDVANAAMIEVSTEVVVTAFYLDGVQQSNGYYDSDSHPTLFEGDGRLMVNSNLAVPGAPEDLEAIEVLSDEISLQWDAADYNASFFGVLVNGEEEAITDETSINIDRLDSETSYTISVFANGLIGNSDTISIEVTTLDVKQHIIPDIILMPNPVSNTLKVKGLDMESWKVYNLSGRLVMEGRTEEINTSQLKKGTYLLSFTGMNGIRYSRKFIKE